MGLRKLIVGNWKMHKTAADAIKLVTELKTKLKAPPHADVAVVPPFTALNSVEIAIQGSPILMGAQNMHWDDEGAYTGEVSAAMLKDCGCHFVLIGHSERRAQFNESPEFLGKKLRAAIHGDLTPIFCVGETAEQRKSGKAHTTIEEQIRRSTTGITAEEMASIVIAYEPVWAIGTGDTATSDQVQEMHGHIRNFLSKTFDKPTASAIRLLYGGSVNPGNAAELLKQRDVNGLLVGGASLDSGKFTDIISKVGSEE